jgi:hypothetical protein
MGPVIRRGSRPLRAGLALGLLAALVAGCDLFRPASPEVEAATAALRPSYATPESCLFYMQIGIERKDNVGQAAYIGALADTTADGRGFHAFFDPVVLSAHVQVGGIPPVDWDRSYEDNFLSIFFSSFPNASYQMAWLEDENYPIANEVRDGAARLLHRRYKVWATLSTGEIRLIAVGYARLSFAKISASRWALVFWDDRVDPAVTAQPTDPDQRTFGYRRLKARPGG